MSNEGFSRTVQFERMTTTEVARAVKDSKGVAIIPVGAVEVHGPHLPVGTDSVETYEIGLRAAQKTGVVIVPPLWYGNSRSFMDFPGTISVRPEVLKELARDVINSLLQQGFFKFVVLDGHGGNYGILDLLVEEVHLETKALICHVRAWELASVPKPENTPDYDGHGGSSETSVMMVLTPDDVDEGQFVDSAPDIALTEHGSVFPSPSGVYSKGAVVFPLSMGEMVEHGHHGDPAFGSIERGEALLNVKVNALVDFLKALKDDQINWRHQGK
ncbi:MAG: creatininase family protein [Anaerolineales bacterium]|jgi:creatinine amidohydrolase